MKIIWVLIAGIFFLNSPANAKIYKWVDGRGKVHFTDDPSRIPEDDKGEVKTFRELPPLPVQKEESKEPSTEKENVPLYDDDGPKKPESSPSPKTKRKKRFKDPAEAREAYTELLEKARESRERQLKKIEELQEMDEKPKDWTANESLEKIIEGLKKSVKKSEKEILKYKNKIKATSLTD